jgi:hypothetical protein
MSSENWVYVGINICVIPWKNTLWKIHVKLYWNLKLNPGVLCTVLEDEQSI